MSGIRKHLFYLSCSAAVAAIALAGVLVMPIEAETKYAIDSARIANADSEPENWLAHGRTYNEQRFSPLDQINENNAGDLGLAWAVPTGMGRGHEASPIVVDGVMFITLPWSNVLALDAKTGEKLWTYDPEVPRAKGRDACCDVVNRGVAVWNGKVYFGALDGRLIALNAGDGSLAWETQTTDTERPYTITGAPRIIDGKVIIGNGGAEFGVRGYFGAYDADSGEQLWRFYTVPGNPELPFEHPELEEAVETWNGKWWDVGGGGTAWDSMAYDPELNTLYVGTGNGSPWNRELRSPGGGDNLYLSSILAINPDTGRLKWHYQTTPADNWDYTATQHIILADMEVEGEDRKVLMQAPKNGFFYMLDRETGELLSAENYVEINWASHVDMETGRPVETGEGVYVDEPKEVRPSPHGGHNWHPMSYSPQTNLVYIPVIWEPFAYTNDTDWEYTPGAWNTGNDFALLPVLAAMVPEPEVAGFLRAWDPIKQQTVWEVKHPTTANGGILSTGGNLVFQGTGTGYFRAYRANNGDNLWEFETKIGMVAPPITYSIDGVQYVTVVAGWGGVPAIDNGYQAIADVSPANKYANYGHVFTFKIGGEAAMPEITQRRFNIIPEPPADDAKTSTIKRGQAVYHKHCAVCHGMMGISGGVLSDLRYSSRAVHDNFKKIVLGGALEQQGMASFDDLLTEEEVDQIHSYIIDLSRRDRAKQIESMQQ